MTLLIALASTLAYLATAGASARPIYGHIRARSINRYTKLPCRNLDDWTDFHQGECTFGAIVLATFWPVAIPAWLAGRTYLRWLRRTTVLSTPERAKIERQRATRITELEHTLRAQGVDV